MNYPESGFVVLAVICMIVIPEQLTAYSSYSQSSVKASIFYGQHKLNLASTTNIMPAFLTYENPNYGLTIQYPYNWKKERFDNNATDAIVGFSPVQQNRLFLSQVILLVNFSSSSSTPLKSLVSEDIEKLRQYYADFKLVDSNASDIIANRNAYRIVYNTDSVRVLQISTVIGDKKFTVEYKANSNSYFAYLPTIQRMIDSIKINTSSNIGSYSDNIIDQLGLKIGNDPYHIAENPLTSNIYITNFRSNTVSVVDSSTDSTVANVTVGKFPKSIDFNQYTNVIYVTNLASNTVSVIDGATNKVLDNIVVGNKPTDLSIDADEPQLNSLIFVANLDSNMVSVIDGLTDKVVGNITVGNKPSAITTDPITNRLYVANSDSNTVSVIDYFTTKKGQFTYNLVDVIPVGRSPNDLAFDPNINTLYVANTDSDTISVVNGSIDKVYDNITVGNSPYNIDLNPDTDTLYVANYGSNTLSVINGSSDTVEAVIPVGRFPYDVRIKPNMNLIYVSNLGSHTLSELNSTSNKVVVGLNVHINPPSAGYIMCNGLYISKPYLRYEIGKELTCESHPNVGFRFSSWSGNMASESNINSPVIVLKLFRYGTLTAGFITPINITIPQEYFVTLYGIILGIILPPIAKLFFTRRERKYLGRYITKIDESYEKFRLDKTKCIDNLEKIRKDIIKLLESGKINEHSYSILEEKISTFIGTLHKD